MSLGHYVFIRTRQIMQSEQRDFILFTYETVIHVNNWLLTLHVLWRSDQTYYKSRSSPHIDKVVHIINAVIYQLH